MATTVVQDSDLAVVSLLPEVFATAIPSKTMMYLRAGCPILALIEPDCALAQLIRRTLVGDRSQVHANRRPWQTRFSARAVQRELNWSSASDWSELVKRCLGTTARWSNGRG